MKEKTPEQIYKRNRTTAKTLEIITPYIFWLFLVLAFLFLFLTIQNSIGNVMDIISLLDSKKHTGVELQANYQMLIEKWGEWTIGTGGSGFQASFIDIGNALFSGFAILNCIICLVWFFCAFMSKWLLPKIAKQISDNNQNSVNMLVFKKEKEVKANENE